MKGRYIYSLLFAVPGFFISLIISFVISGTVAGILWIYVFGDNSWPESVETILPVLFVIIFFLLWSVFISAGFIIGKKFEQHHVLNTGHIIISATATIAPMFLIIIHQMTIGNIGPQSDDIICSRFCNKNGYSGSGMPPKNSDVKTCSCFDNHGREAVRIPIANIISD